MRFIRLTVAANPCVITPVSFPVCLPVPVQQTEFRPFVRILVATHGTQASSWTPYMRTT